MLSTRPVGLLDTRTLQGLYAATPKYFDILAAPIPAEPDVQAEIEIALADSRRQLQFYLDNEEVVAYLDLKFDYPQAGDATINLLLVPEALQSKRYGSQIVQDLESQLLLLGKTKRILAGVYGDNVGAVRFWERLGYSFAVDARPIMSWYAKVLVPELQSI